MQSIYFLQSNDKHYNLLQQKIYADFSTVVSAQNLTLNFGINSILEMGIIVWALGMMK